nr:hypothetical protein [uncultured Hyphomonas sp.]
MSDYKWLLEIAALMDQTKHKRRDFNRKTSKFGYFDRKGPITSELIDEHIRGDENCIGGLMLPDKEKTHFLVFDFDDHEKKTSESIIAGRVAAVCDVLQDSNIPYFVVRSGGGHGYHVWIVFETAKRSDTVRSFGQKVLQRATDRSVWPNEKYDGRGAIWSLKSGDRELLKVELLPKGSGEQTVALPLARKGYLCKVNFSEDGSCFVWEKHPDPISFTFEKCKDKPPGRKKAVDTRRENPDAAFEALATKLDPSSYDDWFRMAMYLIAAFGIESEWAEKRWWEWSEPHSTDHRDRNKWQQCRNTKISPITFWKKAQEAGYEGALPYKSTEQRRLTTLALLEGVRLLRDEINEPYAELGPRRFLPTRSQEFREEMWRRFYEAEGTIAQTTDIDALVAATGAFTSKADIEPIHLRFAACGDKRYLFLADTDYGVIEVDSDGWRACDDPPVIFRVGDSLPLPMPLEGAIEDLLGILNVDRENMIFVLAWMLTAIYFPGKQCPILLLDGPAGSGKSSALSTIIKLIDPKIGAEAGPPKSEDDLFVSAYNGAIVSFDNVSSLAKLSDALCRLSTRGGLRKRMLYTNFDVAAMDARRPIVIAGIDPTMYEQDLLERIVRVDLHKPEEYVEDSKFEQRVEQLRPKLLGAILSLLSRVMDQVPNQPSGWSRFGSFTQLGECVARDLGFAPGWFSNEYRRRFEEMSAESADADSVVSYVSKMAANQRSGVQFREATASELWEEMRDQIRSGHLVVPDSDVPPNARAMSTRISRAQSVLSREHGISVSRGTKRSFIFRCQEGSVIELEKYISNGNIRSEPTR